jgi:hypothetical protein
LKISDFLSTCLPAPSFFLSSKRKLWDIESYLPFSYNNLRRERKEKEEEKRRSWVAVILENLTWEIMKEVVLQGKARRATRTSLSSHREALVLLNWKRSDYMDKWLLITIPPSTELLTLQLSISRYIHSLPPSLPLPLCVVLSIIKVSFYRVR